MGNILGDAGEILNNAGQVIGGKVQDTFGAAQKMAEQATGAVLGAAGAPVYAATENAVGNDRTSIYNQEIDRARQTQPNYVELEKLWNDITYDKTLLFVKATYFDIGLTEVQFNAMAEKDVAAFKKALSEEQFKKTLDELHEQVKKTAIEQLEYERDNPEQAGQRAPEAPEQETANSLLTELFIKWVGERLASNLEGAKNESGVGAQILRGTLGISIKDIEKNGILGGQNSYLRKIIPTWSDGGGFFGGENSFFRKPFG